MLSQRICVCLPLQGNTKLLNKVFASLIIFILTSFITAYLAKTYFLKLHYPHAQEWLSDRSFTLIYWLLHRIANHITVLGVVGKALSYNS